MTAAVVLLVLIPQALFEGVIDWINALQIGGIPTDKLRTELPFIGVVVKKDEDLETVKNRREF